MRRQFSILFIMLMLLALHGALSGCARKAAAPIQASAGYTSPEVQTGQIDARKAATPPPGGFVYHGNTTARGPVDDKDPLWRRYATRGQAFENCPPGYEPVIASSKPAPARRTSRKAKPSARRPVVTQAPLAGDPLCPPGCVPISRNNPAVVVPWSGPSAPAAPVPGASAPLPAVSASGSPTPPPATPVITGGSVSPTAAPVAPAR